MQKVFLCLVFIFFFSSNLIQAQEGLNKLTLSYSKPQGGGLGFARSLGETDPELSHFFGEVSGVFNALGQDSLLPWLQFKGAVHFPIDYRGVVKPFLEAGYGFGPSKFILGGGIRFWIPGTPFIFTPSYDNLEKTKIEVTVVLSRYKEYRDGTRSVGSTLNIGLSNMFEGRTPTLGGAVRIYF